MPGPRPGKARLPGCHPNPQLARLASSPGAQGSFSLPDAKENGEASGRAGGDSPPHSPSRGPRCCPGSRPGRENRTASGLPDHRRRCTGHPKPPPHPEPLLGTCREPAASRAWGHSRGQTASPCPGEETAPGKEAQGHQINPHWRKLEALGRVRERRARWTVTVTGHVRRGSPERALWGGDIRAETGGVETVPRSDCHTEKNID